MTSINHERAALVGLVGVIEAIISARETPEFIRKTLKESKHVHAARTVLGLKTETEAS